MIPDRHKTTSTARILMLVALAPLIAQTPAPRDTPLTPGEGAGSPATSAPAPVAPGPTASGAVVAIIPVHGMIHAFTFESLKRRADQAIAQGATWIVFELDTYGGQVDSAMEISKYIKGLPRPTLAWINHNAYSAGIMIAAACNQIVMAPASATGDGASIVPLMSLSPTERAKALSPILAEFGDSAGQNGYDYAMFHAMCVLGVEVYLIEHKETGLRRLVNQADQRVMVQGKAVGPGVIGGVVKKLIPESMVGQPTVGDVGIELATEADRKQWKLIKQVHNGKTLFTVHQDQAFEIGLSKNDPAARSISTDADIKSFLNAATVQRINQHWVVNISFFLCTPWMRGILVLVFLLGTYMEAQAPGLGAPGLSALAALVLLLGAPYLIGLAEIWHLILFIIGVGMLLAEIFVVPGFGVLGIGGIVCMFVGLVLMVVPTTGQGFMPLPAPGRGDLIRESVMWTMLGLIGAAVGFYFLTRYFGSIPLMNRLVLQGASGGRGHTNTGRPIELHPPGSRISGDEAFGGGTLKVGAAGRTLTGLRPSGRVEIDGEVVDVVTHGGWIEQGVSVRVVEVQGNRIVVDADSNDT